MSPVPARDWVAIHRNAREHYAVPRLLHRIGLLREMLTDVWAGPCLRRLLPARARIRSRWHPELADVPVSRLGCQFLVQAALNRKLGSGGWWERTEREDRIFQRAMASLFRARARRQAPGVLFSFSYDAGEPFESAKALGWRMVLGQIDPGPAEWDLVDRETKQYAALRIPRDAPSPEYWKRWRLETELSDVIVVNSEWSRKLLLEGGVPAAKMVVAPLIYESPVRLAPKRYPSRFTKDRPLRVLFLGRITLRKGVGQLLEAMENLADEPILLRMVGPCAIRVHEAIGKLPNTRIEPSVGRDAADALYDWADVFILPTLSDGFGMTQLEAMARRVPLIVSRQCAQVVRHRANGWLLETVSARTVAEAIVHALNNPQELADWSSGAAVPECCSMASVSETYQLIADRLHRDENITLRTHRIA
jgi:glycosyltransferase involved in cell wall biosynthesis